MSIEPERIEECRNKLQELLERKLLNKKQIVCFGNNDSSRCAIEFLKEIGIEVSYVLDNRAEKGVHIAGIPLERPDKFHFTGRTCVLIGSRFYNEMKEQLVGLGCKENQIYEIVQYPQMYNPSLTKYTFYKEVKYVKEGYDVYRCIRKKVGKKKMLFVSPAKSIGDIYLILAYLGKYFKELKDGYCIIVHTNAAAKICEESGEKNYVIIKQMDRFCRFIQFAGEHNIKAYVLNALPMYTNKVKNLTRCNRCSSFDVSFRNYVTDNNNEAVIHPLKIKKIPNHYVAEKSIIVSPYTNFLKPLEKEFWEKLCSRLIEEGFTVYTNGASPKEPPIVGTIPISYSFSESLGIINQSGFFIAVRSGLCDVLSSTTAQMYILYPEHKLSNEIMAIDYFSLKRMGLNETAIEISYCWQEHEKIIEDIVIDIREKYVEKIEK